MAQLIGPISQLTVNSKYYSANPPPRIRTPTLPHVTIQCPVYKEGLEAVIAPTIKSIEQAISTYELQGGTANIFINDDGMQLLTPEERLARTKFYSDHNIGWVARPKHGEDGFLRQGKFKKVRTTQLFSGTQRRVIYAGDLIGLPVVDRTPIAVILWVRCRYGSGVRSATPRWRQEKK